MQQAIFKRFLSKIATLQSNLQSSDTKSFQKVWKKKVVTKKLESWEEKNFNFYILAIKPNIMDKKKKQNYNL